MPSSSNILLYGKGIFTTVTFRGGEVLFWEKHWRRLNENAAKVGIDLAEHSERSTRDALHKAIASSGLTDGRARITFYDESPSEIWSNDREQKTTLSIIVAERRVVPQPFKLTVSPYPVNSRSPLAGVKSCNYLENILALGEVRKRGFNEAVRLNERGHVTSAAMANIIWLKAERLFTPALTTGCLAGTTREYVLENFDCEEVETDISDLNDAEAMFLTSAGIGIIEIAAFENRVFSSSIHPVVTLFSVARDAG